MDAATSTQEELADALVARSLLDQLLADSRLYTQSADYTQLLEFVVRLRNFAPFNAMLLQIQKPGLSYAASARDWRERFQRQIKTEARPLVILWPFGPVAFVYDVLDTEGDPLPIDVSTFFARGCIDAAVMHNFLPLLRKRRIGWQWIDAGDNRAGSIRVISRGVEDVASTYEIAVNKNHAAAVQFSTLAHELGHLFLGHLGPDQHLKVPERPRLTHAQHELEAESVAYIVCTRNGVECRSKVYLSNFMKASTTVQDVDVYQVMRAAGQVENVLQLSAHTKYDAPGSKVSQPSLSNAAPHRLVAH